MSRLICYVVAVSLTVPTCGCSWEVAWTEDLSDFDEFHMETNEGPLHMYLPPGFLYSATIQRQEDGRYLLEMSLVQETRVYAVECPVDVHSRYDYPWDESPPYTCPVLDELPPRYLTDDEVTRVRTLFEEVRVVRLPVFACVPGWEPGPITFLDWDDLTLDDWCCSAPFGPCMDRDETWRIVEVLAELATVQGE